MELRGGEVWEHGSDIRPRLIERDTAVPHRVERGDRGGAAAGLRTVHEHLLALGAEGGDRVGGIRETVLRALAAGDLEWEATQDLETEATRT